jgi:DNA-binding winged helix-turn-helix (wHTH) protein/TolB-like protein
VRFRFGLFELDAASGELRREGALVRLQPQPAQVLGFLVQHAGKVVSRDELRAAVWGNATFVDFDRGLNFCISQVRSALRDDSAEPRYIRTVPKQGYQFISPVERAAASATAQTPAQSTEPQLGDLPLGQPHGFRRRRMVLAAAAVLVAGLAVLAAYWPRLTAGASQAPIVAVVRFDNETGNAEMDRASDGLTDTVVAQLTASSQGRYAVIGNAKILRLPREQRDLKAIAASLNANYVVLGQVQSSGTQARFLAHLIHMPEQTHVWVVRMDHPLTDQLGFQSEGAQKITAEFSPRVAAGDKTPLHPPAKQ